MGVRMSIQAPYATEDVEKGQAIPLKQVQNE